MNMHPSKSFRAQIYCRDILGVVGLTNPIDVLARDFDEAARNATGENLTTDDSSDEPIVRIWDRSGETRIYYRTS